MGTSESSTNHNCLGFMTHNISAIGGVQSKQCYLEKRVVREPCKQRTASIIVFVRNDLIGYGICKNSEFVFSSEYVVSRSNSMCKLRKDNLKLISFKINDQKFGPKLIKS